MASQILRNYFYNVLPKDLKRLSRATIEQARNDDGLYGILMLLTDAGDNLIAMTSEIMEIWDSNALTTNLTAQVADQEKLVRAMTDSSAFAAGPFYYLVNVAQHAGSASLLGSYTLRPAGEYSEGDGLFEDASGTTYAENGLCLLQQCVEKSIEDYNRKPMADGVGVSREQAGTALYLLPVLLLLTGLISTLWFIPCGKRWTRIPTCCFMICSCIMLPFIFLLVGGLLFPLILGWSDVCYGGLNVASQYVQGSAQGICEAQLQGMWEAHTWASGRSASACRVSLSGDSVVHVPVDAMFAAVAGDCGAKGTLTQP